MLNLQSRRRGRALRSRRTATPATRTSHAEVTVPAKRSPESARALPPHPWQKLSGQLGRVRKWHRLTLGDRRPELDAALTWVTTEIDDKLGVVPGGLPTANIIGSGRSPP